MSSGGERGRENLGVDSRPALKEGEFGRYRSEKERRNSGMGGITYRIDLRG